MSLELTGIHPANQRYSLLTKHIVDVVVVIKTTTNRPTNQTHHHHHRRRRRHHQKPTNRPTNQTHHHHHRRRRRRRRPYHHKKLQSAYPAVQNAGQYKHGGTHNYVETKIVSY